MLLGWKAAGLLFSQIVCFDRRATLLYQGHCLAASRQLTEEKPRQGLTALQALSPLSFTAMIEARTGLAFGVGHHDALEPLMRGVLSVVCQGN